MLTEMDRSIGPYGLLELLGQGGMGQVWRARHRLSGQTVALKTLKISSEGLLRSLRREIHALARLRHPGVVRILDEGLEGGVPWYAMELLEGQTLRQWRIAVAAQQRPPLTEAASAESWWTLSPKAVERHGAAEVPEDAAGEPGACGGPGPVAPAATREVLSLVRRLCAPLAYLHGEGLVHCDLKPENVLVRAASSDSLAVSEEPEDRAALAARGSRLVASGWPVLVDFGLAGQFATLSREALELETGASGTVAYMAPEQLRGESLDARADLYALGCILYELLTGRPPFLGKTPLEVLEQHLRATPPPPSSLVPWLGPELDAVVLRLLEKEPRRRFGHADDVGAALAQLGAEDGLAAEGSRPRAYLYRPGIAGREAPLSRLKDRLLRLQEHDAGGLVLLGGESGVGKTRLLMEVGKEAGRRRLQVLGGECQDGAARPLEALRKPLLAIADRCRARGEQETERLLGRRAKVLALYEPTLGSLPGQQRYPEPAELPADAAQQRLHSYLTETLAAFAEEASVVLLLDDLQWADDLTLGFLGSLLRTQTLETPQAVPLLVLGTYRSEEVGAPDRGPLQDLLQASGVGHMALDRLAEPAVGSMVGDMLALEPPPRHLVHFLSRQSEGNPFFVAEYLRAAVDEQLLWRDGPGRWQVAGPSEREASEEDYEALALPVSVRELVGRRLQGLPQGARALLEAAAVLGREVELATAAEMTGLGDALFDEALDELLRRQVLEASGPRSARFVHDKIREVAYERLQPEPKQALHRAAAEVIEARPAEERELLLAALALHWERARVQQRARPCYLAAARQAESGSALRESERLYRAYLRLVEKPEPESISGRNELAVRVLRFQGRMPEALAEIRLALEEASTIGDRRGEGASLLLLGEVNGMTGRIEEAQSLSELALCIHREIGDRGSEGRALEQLGSARFCQGRVTEAQDFCEQALSIHRELGDRQSEGRTRLLLGTVSFGLGRLNEAQAFYEQALLVYRELDNRRGQGKCLSGLAVVFHELGRFEQARLTYEQALDIDRELCDRRREAVDLGNLSIVRGAQGHLEEALALAERALLLHREMGNRRAEALQFANLSELRLQQGQIAEAQESSRQALEISRDIGNVTAESESLGCLAKVYQAQGRLEEARRLLEEAGDLYHRAGDGKCEGRTLGELAHLARRQAFGTEEAERLATKSEKLLSEAGAKVGMAWLLCYRGHIALGRGFSGRELLGKARTIAESLGISPRSSLAKAIATLDRAVEAFEAGQHHRLFRGELVEDLPEALRRRFIESGELAEPEELGGR